MAHQIIWTKIILETFLEESGLNDRVSMGDSKARILEGVMRTRCAGKTIVEQAEMFNCSVDSINKYIAELKSLYDATQKHSLILPVRKNSKKEEALDKIH